MITKEDHENLRATWNTLDQVKTFVESNWQCLYSTEECPHPTQQCASGLQEQFDGAVDYPVIVYYFVAMENEKLPGDVDNAKLVIQEVSVNEDGSIISE